MSRVENLYLANVILCHWLSLFGPVEQNKKFETDKYNIKQCADEGKICVLMICLLLPMNHGTVISYCMPHLA